jgi:glycosyltransferase involved in cell wall biosynthesis
MEARHKRAVIFSETYLPLFGGAEMYTYNFARQLVARGIPVTIATYEIKGKIPEEYLVEGITVVHLPKITKKEFHKSFHLITQIRKLIREHDYVFSNYTYVLSALASILRIGTHKPITVFAHGFGTIIDDEHPKTYHVYRSLSLHFCSNVVTTSEEIAAIVQKFTSKVLVATAVDFTHIDACLSSVAPIPHAEKYEGKKTLLTIRRLVEKNGIQYCIEMIPYLLKLRKDFTYVVIGGGRLQEQLEKRAGELEILEYVQFLGALPNDDVFNYIQSSDVVMFPSSAEALSLAAIECMYIGTPVTLSAIGGLLELAGASEARATLIDLFGRSESVYTAPEPSAISPETYVLFAEKVSHCMDADAEIVRKAALAKTYVKENYDWKYVADTILTFNRSEGAVIAGKSHK